MNPVLRLTGDRAVSVTFPGEISVENNLKVRALQHALEQEAMPGVVEIVPAYCSVMVHYDPMVLSYERLEAVILRLVSQSGSMELPAELVTEIPVLYGGAWGPDLEEVAQFEQISVEEVIRRHSARESFIYMIAFTPGLPYIGSPEKTFSVPRRKTPRVKLPAGSVTIWESQTTVFPVEQPGGWNVIGRTPLRLFDPQDEASPFLLRSGQWVRFRPINQEEYDRIEAQIAAGTYRPIQYKKGDA